MKVQAGGSSRPAERWVVRGVKGYQQVRHRDARTCPTTGVRRVAQTRHSSYSQNECRCCGAEGGMSWGGSVVLMKMQVV